MNRIDLVKKLHKLGWYCNNNEGTKHEKFRNPNKPGKVIEVPRHKVINKFLALSILKDAQS